MTYQAESDDDDAKLAAILQSEWDDEEHDGTFQLTNPTESKAALDEDERIAAKLQSEYRKQIEIEEKMQYLIDRNKALELYLLEEAARKASEVVNPKCHGNPKNDRRDESSMLSLDTGVDDSFIAAKLQSRWNKQEKRDEQIQYMKDRIRALELQLLEEKDDCGSTNSNLNHGWSSRDESVTEVEYLSDKMKALELQLQENSDLKLRRKSEVDEMKSSSFGKAVLLANLLIEEIQKYTVEHDLPSANARIPQSGPTKLIEALVTDDMVNFAEPFIETYERFKALGYRGQELYVDIGYHYTTGANVDKIRTVGLLTPAERSAQKIDTHKEKGRSFGEGIYTSSNPFAFLHYGDVGLMVARILGRIKSQESSTAPSRTLPKSALRNSFRRSHPLNLREAVSTICHRKQPPSSEFEATSAGSTELARREEYDTIRGNKQTRSLLPQPGESLSSTHILNTASATAPAASSRNNSGEGEGCKDHDYWNEDVLQSSSQCLPMVRYDASIIGKSDPNSGVRCIGHNKKVTVVIRGKHSYTVLTLQRRLQRILDEFFHQEP